MRWKPNLKTSEMRRLIQDRWPFLIAVHILRACLAIMKAADSCLFVLSEAGLCGKERMVQQLILAQLSNDLSLPPLPFPGRLIVSSPHPDSGSLNSPKPLLFGRCLWRSEILGARRQDLGNAWALQSSFLSTRCSNSCMHIILLLLA